jgi:hypothetical protein
LQKIDKALSVLSKGPLESRVDGQDFSPTGYQVSEVDVYEIELKLWRNEEEKDWTAEINGRRYERVAIEWVHAHVHGALLDAEEALIEILEKPHSVSRETMAYAEPRTFVLQ